MPRNTRVAHISVSSTQGLRLVRQIIPSLLLAEAIKVDQDSARVGELDFFSVRKDGGVEYRAYSHAGDETFYVALVDRTAD